MDRPTMAKWRRRWERIPEKYRRLVAGVLPVLVLFGGLLLYDWHEKRWEDRCLIAMYRAVVALGEPHHPVHTPLFLMHADRGDWERLFGDELRKALEKPDDLDRRVDHEWGIAYTALKAPRDDWTCRQDMDAATQAEMVRYLCFRTGVGLWRRYSWSSNVGEALEALDTYPDAALEQNRPRLVKTLRMVLDANLPVTPDPAQMFLLARLDEAWAREILWDALAHHKPASRGSILGSGPKDDEWDLTNLMQILWEKAKAGDPHAAGLVLRFAEYDDRHLENAYREHKAVVQQWREAIRARRERLQDVAEGRATDEAPEAAP